MCDTDALFKKGPLGKMFFDPPKPPEPPQINIPSQTEAQPEQSDPAVQTAKNRERRRNAARGGRQSTILTGAQGTGGATTPAKTALGQ